MRQLIISCLIFPGLVTFQAIAETKQDQGDSIVELEQVGNKPAHTITAFGGLGSLLVDNTHRAAVALNYSYHFTFFSEPVGVGLTTRHIFADEPETMVVPLAIFNPFFEFKFAVGPAIALRSNKLFAGARAGFRYDYFFDYVVLTPEFNVDVFASNLTLVYGLSLGLAF